MALQPEAPSPPVGVTRIEEVAALLSAAIADGRCQERRSLSRPVRVQGSLVEAVVVEKIFGTASGARLVRFLPEGRRWVWKNGDVRLEHAIMCALRQMNGRWKRAKLAICGQLVQAVTYEIVALGASAGLVEAISKSWTLRDLSQQHGHTEQRVLMAIRKDPLALDRLAATTVAYLTAGYVLGIRDGHDDNLMVRSDGAFFRVDFGWAFGATPEIDAPLTFVPKAVTAALGELRWQGVVACCRDALIALSDPTPLLPAHTASTTAFGSSTSYLSSGYAYSASSTSSLADFPPGWHCLSRVQELLPWESEAAAHCATLTLEDFCDAVACANQWSLTRLAKNTLREVARLWKISDPDADDDDDDHNEPGERIVFLPRTLPPSGHSGSGYPAAVRATSASASIGMPAASGAGDGGGGGGHFDRQPPAAGPQRGGSGSSSGSCSKSDQNNSHGTFSNSVYYSYIGSSSTGAWPRPRPETGSASCGGKGGGREGSSFNINSSNLAIATHTPVPATGTATATATATVSAPAMAATSAPPIVSAFDPSWAPLPAGDPFARTPPGSPRPNGGTSRGPCVQTQVSWPARRDDYRAGFGTSFEPRQSRLSRLASAASQPPPTGATARAAATATAPGSGGPGPASCFGAAPPGGFFRGFEAPPDPQWDRDLLVSSAKASAKAGPELRGWSGGSGRPPGG